MRPNQTHAVRNLLQAVMGYIELGREDDAKRVVREIDHMLGQSKVPWCGTKQVFECGKAKVKVEAMPDKAVFLEVAMSDARVGVAMGGHTARALGELLLAFADMSDIKASVSPSSTQ